VSDVKYEKNGKVKEKEVTNLADTTIISEELKSLLDAEKDLGKSEITKEMVKRIAAALDGTNPLWRNEIYEDKSNYGDTVTFPIILMAAIDIRKLVYPGELAKCPLTRLLNGGMEFEYYQPIKVGDTIWAKGKLAELYERDGSKGKLLFMINEVIYQNQREEKVAKGRFTFIRF